MIKFFIYLKAIISLWYATKQADKAYEGSTEIGKNRDGSPRYARKNVRYYVMPDENDKLICMNRRNFHKLRTNNQMSPEVLVRHLTKECFYFTPHANGTSPISEKVKDRKKKMYLDYCIKKYEDKKADIKRQRDYVKNVKRDLYASSNRPRQNWEL